MRCRIRPALISLIWELVREHFLYHAHKLKYLKNKRIGHPKLHLDLELILDSMEHRSG